MKAYIVPSIVFVLLFFQYVPVYSFALVESKSENTTFRNNSLKNDVCTEAYLMVLCDLDAKITVDGELIGQVVANEYKKFTLIPGQHSVIVESLDGSMRWENDVQLAQNEQTLIRPKLTPTDRSIGIPGIFKDPTDQHEYKTVTIGDQEWFAENYMRNDGASIPPNRSLANVPVYGRLYKPTNIIAPSGWRLPTEDDYKKLMSLYEKPFEALTEGKSGFNAQFAGIIDIDSYVLGFGTVASFWTGTAGPEIRDVRGNRHPSIKNVTFDKTKKQISIYHSYVHKYFSVRFVRDIK